MKARVKTRPSLSVQRSQAPFFQKPVAVQRQETPEEDVELQAKRETIQRMAPEAKEPLQTKPAPRQARLATPSRPFFEQAPIQRQEKDEEEMMPMASPLQARLAAPAPSQPFFQPAPLQRQGIPEEAEEVQAQQPPMVAAGEMEVVPTGTPGGNSTTLTITGEPNTQYHVGVNATESRGHSHASPGRPLGTITPSANVTTGDDGTATVTYTSSIVAGEEHITVKELGQADAPEATLDIRVHVAGLAELGAGNGYNLVGQTATHPDNHYGTAGAITAYQTVGTNWAAIPGTLTPLVQAIQAARAQPDAPAPPPNGPPLTNAQVRALLLQPTQAALDALSNAGLAQVLQAVQNWPTLGYNDMSLAWGGLFDIRATWAPPHNTHRVGTNMDFRLRNLGALHRLVVEQLMVDEGINVFHENAAHWHLTS